MSTPITIALIANGLMLTLALGALLIILWQDSRREINLYYGLFMLTMFIWASGSLLARIAAQTLTDDALVIWGLRLLNIGFGGACISGYLLAITSTEVRNRLFRSALIGGVGLVLLYQIILAFLGVDPDFLINESGVLRYEFGQVNGFIYLFFAVTTFILVWRRFNQIRQVSLSISLIILSAGQIMAIISPRIRELAFTESTSTLAALGIGYAFMQRQIMEPLLGRTRQFEAVRDVGLAISSTINFQEVLETIARQAADLMNASASAIYLYQEKDYPEKPELVLKAVHEIPRLFLGTALKEGEGLVGLVAKEKASRLVNEYRKNWNGKPDIPIAFETFGAVIAVPLIHRDQVEGVLLVITEIEGQIFDKEDMQLLQLLGPQAAVAISNSQLFAQERALNAQVTEARNQLKAVLDSTENPVLAVDRHLKIILANPALVTLIADTESPESISGKPLLEYINRKMLPADLRQFIRDIRKSHTHVYEVQVDERDYWCHVAPLTDPGHGWVAVLNDITELKRMDRLKSHIVHMTSHDLKNPLTAIMFHLDLLESAGKNVLNEKMNRYVQIIWEQVDRMQRIIGGILDLNRLELGAPVPEPFEMEPVLVRTVHDMEVQALMKGVNLTDEISINGAMVRGDSGQIGQAIANLIENAIKFTPAGGEVHVKAETTERQITICVQDNGIGIPREAQSQIFDRFFRLDKDNNNGSGLGLSLVKAVVDRYKGNIWLHSAEGEGSSFYISLPLVRQKNPAGTT